MGTYENESRILKSQLRAPLIVSCDFTELLSQGSRGERMRTVMSERCFMETPMKEGIPSKVSDTMMGIVSTGE